MSLSSIPTRTSVPSATISAGKAGSTGRVAAMPAAPPRRGGGTGRALDERVGDLVSRLAGKCARSVAWSRTRSPRRHRDHLISQPAGTPSPHAAARPASRARAARAPEVTALVKALMILRRSLRLVRSR
jgi:hypothetical protein